MPLLTKSKYMIGLKCPKSLWISCYKNLEDPDLATKHRFDEGNIVGELAQKLYPKGILATYNIDELLDKRVPVFEAGFTFQNCYSRADILVPSENNSWDIIEVKSSTSAKPEHIDDLRFQIYCYKNYGLKINKIYLMHINKEYVLDKKLNLNSFFIKEDVTDKVLDENIDDKIKYFQEIISSETYDETKFESHCDSPKTCPLPEYDWNFLPEDSVFTLYMGGKKSKELFNSDIISISQIPENFKLTKRQEIQVNSCKNNSIHTENDKINKELDKLKYPLYFIDFETYSTAIPCYKGMKPYQKTPFQFSLHIQKTPDGNLEHISYLSKNSKDPRFDFLTEMYNSIGNEGSIIVYNQAFEKSVLNELKKTFPEYKKWIENICERIFDLLPIFRNFHYYNPKQNGSCSIKKVLPALIPNKSYDNLDIGNGEDASLLYYYSINNYYSNEDFEKIQKQLEEYCKLDTLAMVDILNELKRIVN